MSISRFSFPVPIIFGPGSIQVIPEEINTLNLTKPLIITDPAMTKTAAFQTILRTLEDKHLSYRIFSDIRPNPHDTDIEGGVKVYNSSGCDLIIGAGGGSAMDAAKALAVLIGEGGRIEDYDSQSSNKKEIQGPLPKIILIPTTSGTGSEVGKCSVINSTSQGRKIFLCHPLMLPSLSVLDPELTVSLPPDLTAATGMDALTHNIESLTAPIFHPICDGIAVKGIQLIIRNLENAVRNPDDIEARGNMMLAAVMGGIAFQKDLGAAHSLSHALSAVCDIQHGLANAIVLPAVMDFNKEVSKQEYSAIAMEFGINIFNLSPLESAEQAIYEIKSLNERIGIPSSLREAGVSADQVDEISRIAFLDPCHTTNSRRCTRDNLRTLLKESM